MLAAGQQAQLVKRIEASTTGRRGPDRNCEQLLLRGVGVHHAGVLPKYRRIVEELFQQKLLSVAVCTETLSAGINLPARSVVLPSIIKGPPEKKKLIEASAAQQIFGRAGRPQFDKQGYVYVLAHEDDVRIARWREKYDQIPEDTKDPGLLQAKKAMKRKMPRAPGDRSSIGTKGSSRSCWPRRPASCYSRGAVALAAAGLHARRLAGGRSDPQPGGQAADGQRPPRGRASGSWNACC